MSSLIPHHYPRASALTSHVSWSTISWNISDEPSSLLLAPCPLFSNAPSLSGHDRELLHLISERSRPQTSGIITRLALDIDSGHVPHKIIIPATAVTYRPGNSMELKKDISPSTNRTFPKTVRQ